MCLISRTQWRRVFCNLKEYPGAGQVKMLEAASKFLLMILIRLFTQLGAGWDL
jgi:hypothetical protein